MKYIAVAILGVLTVAALGYLAYQRVPTTRVEAYTVTQFVPEMRTRTVKRAVEVNGQDVEVKMEVPYTVSRAVHETRERTITPTLLQKLQFWCLVGVAVIFAAYMLFVLGLWARDKLNRKRESADTRDTQKRVDGIVTFCTGILVGFLGASDFADHPDRPDHNGTGAVLPAAVKPFDDSFNVPMPSDAPSAPLPDEP